MIGSKLMMIFAVMISIIVDAGCTGRSKVLDQDSSFYGSSRWSPASVAQVCHHNVAGARTNDKAPQAVDYVGQARQWDFVQQLKQLALDEESTFMELQQLAEPWSQSLIELITANRNGPHAMDHGLSKFERAYQYCLNQISPLPEVEYKSCMKGYVYVSSVLKTLVSHVQTQQKAKDYSFIFQRHQNLFQEVDDGQFTRSYRALLMQLEGMADYQFVVLTRRRRLLPRPNDRA